jgi:glycosyltransferase involved in cell wall biosynthesis
MRVGIDAVTPGASLEEAVAGMRQYLIALISAMSAKDAANQFVVFESAHTPLGELDRLSNVLRVVCPGVPRLRSARVVYQNTAFPLLLRRYALDTMLGTCNVIPIGNPRPYVVVLQSLQYYVFGSTFGRARGTYLRTFVRSSLRRADAVIALSKAAKDEAVRFTGVNPRKVAVVYHGVPPDVTAFAATLPAERDRLTPPYILVISSLMRYKNIERVLQAYAELRHKHDFEHRLRILGQSGEITVAELRAKAEVLGVAGWVDFLGGVDREAVPPQIAEADALVYVSLHETFGLPPLEAMALGCPVIAARASAIPEVVGSAAELVDPLDSSDISRGIARVILDPEHRRQLVQTGRQRASEFTWERAAASVLEVLQATLASPSIRRGNAVP